MRTDWGKKTTLFLSSQTISLFGSMLVQYAITWHITLVTKDGVQMALVTVCGFLPQLLISLFAGVWADRYSRKMMIMLADGAIALSTMVLAVMFSMGYDALWILYVTSIIRSLGAGIQTPAVGAMLPDIVPEDQLMRVNGINASIQSVMMLLAPAAAGMLYGNVGMASIFWIDVVTAIIGISIMSQLRVAPPKRVENAQGHFFDDMVSGFRYLGKTRWLYQFLVFYLAYSFMFGPVVSLTPLMVARTFGEEPWRLVAHELAFAVGSLMGGLSLGFVSARIKNKMRMVLVGSAAFGLFTCIMGFSPNFWFYIGTMVAQGLTMPMVNSGAMTVLQMRVEPEMMGRVFGLVSIAGTAAMPLSTVLFGPLANVISVEQELIVTGILMVLITLYIMRFPDIIQAGEPIVPDEAAGSGVLS